MEESKNVLLILNQGYLVLERAKAERLQQIANLELQVNIIIVTHYFGHV